MSQPLTEAELQSYVDDRLPPERAEAVAAWLSGHPEDAARVAAYRTQNSALRARLDPIAEEPLPPSLDLRLGAFRPRRRFAMPSAAFAASLAAAIMLSGTGGWMLRGLSEPPRAGTGALAREAAASYAVYASDPVRPVEIAGSNAGDLDRWISQKLARTVSAPDLTAAGLQLMGGRVVPTEYGPAGFYIYDDGEGRRIALYVRPMKIDRTDRMTGREEGPVKGWTWADDGLGFGLFGTQSKDILHPIADMVRAQYRSS